MRRSLPRPGGRDKLRPALLADYLRVADGNVWQAVLAAWCSKDKSAYVQAEFARNARQRGQMLLNRQMTRLAAVSADTIAAAALCLRAGGLVAMPTETVYGLAADATSDTAVAAIFAAKARPAINPLIVHVLDIETARQHAVFGAPAEKLAFASGPGLSPWSCPRRRPAGSACLRAPASTPWRFARRPTQRLARSFKRRASRSRRLPPIAQAA